ncbi:MAG: ferrous iron transport protein A [Phycisphaerae bacterium]|nr:ferrous iron transport protein A [Phycisphaerae bacterium]
MSEENKIQPVPLLEMSPGKTARVVSIDAGHDLKNRLSSLGVLAGSTLHVIRNEGAGQLIVMIKNSKVVLGRGASSKIFVTPT